MMIIKSLERTGRVPRLPGEEAPPVRPVAQLRRSAKQEANMLFAEAIDWFEKWGPILGLIVGAIIAIPAFLRGYRAGKKFREGNPGDLPSQDEKSLE
jgi:hypothetical protein